MARLRFPGRPGYRFDRIGVRYGADEARQTTDPTLAVVASIHKGLRRFRDIFGDSDEDDTEFEGFTSKDIKKAEQNLQRALKKEKLFQEQQAEEQQHRYERSQATLANLAATELDIPPPSVNFKKPYKKIVDLGIVQDSSAKFKKRTRDCVAEVKEAIPQQNGVLVPEKTSNIKHVKLKRLTHTVEQQPVFRRPVGRPRKNAVPDRTGNIQNGSSFESISTLSLFGSKPSSKYKFAAKQILARATKQAAQTSSKLLQTPTHKVRKFVLPSKSSRSSRVIKPNKRFLEDDSVHQLVAKQPKLSPTPPPMPTSTINTSIFGMGVGDDKSANTFSTFSLSLSPFNMNREKGFPAFSAAPQPSGTSSFMDGLSSSQKPLGSLDQPLIIEGKRPRKPSLIMRMKLVEDDPEDEIRLQQQLSDVASPVKPSSSFPDGQKPVAETKNSLSASPSLPTGYGVTKSLIAPAKLFTDPSSSSSSSKSFKSHLKHQKAPLPSQSTVVLRQAKLQLNRTALNRSKAALARSLKAQLKRERRMERRNRKKQGLTVSTQPTLSPGSSFSQLSPFSQHAAGTAIEKQKSGLFEGIDSKPGSFSPGSFGSPPVTPSSIPVTSSIEKEDFQSSLIDEKLLLRSYTPGSKERCLVCKDTCIVKRNRKLPTVPLCKRCKKFYFYQLSSGSRGGARVCSKGGQCNIDYSKKSITHCFTCKYKKFTAILRKSLELREDVSSKVKDELDMDLTMEPKPLRRKSGDSITSDSKISLRKKKRKVGALQMDIKEEFASPNQKQRHKSENSLTLDKRKKHKSGDGQFKQRHKHKSGDKILDLSSVHRPAKSPSHSKDFINANNLDKPLSVDVGEDGDLFSLSPPQTFSSTKSSPGRGLKKFGGDLNGSDQNDDDDNNDSRSRGSSRGPRIKHVCRRAAMVFPQQRATFSEDPLQRKTLTLSALPNEEKQQLWAKSKNKQEVAADSSSDDSIDEKPLSKLGMSPDKKLLSPRDEKLGDGKKERQGDIKREKRALGNLVQGETKRERKLSGGLKSDGMHNVIGLARKVSAKRLHLEKKKEQSLVPKHGKMPKRKIRCRECKGCKTPECGVCVFCRDKRKFGGPGKFKKCCINSVCLAPKIPRKATDAFIEPKSPGKTYRRDDDDNSGSHRSNNSNSRFGSSSSSLRLHGKKSSNHEKMDSSGDGTKDDVEEELDAEGNEFTWENGHPSTSVPCGLDMDGSRLHTKTVTNINNNRKTVRYAKGKYTPAVEATIQLALADVRNPFMGRMAEAYVGRMGKIKRKEKISVPQKQTSMELKPVQNQTAYSFDVPLKTHLIRADYREDYDIETAWSHGFSLTVTGPSCIRTLCYLCGSAGKDSMLFCIVCCQPYHVFCLEEDERPDDSGNEDEGDDGGEDSNHCHGHGNSSTISWCCRRCQFCHVCGQQNGLLKCHRCKDTYHPECLGPNYPTRPSRKNIWVCTKCVRCKSCGATTPGVGTNATWTYDFSLCYDCGKLMDKGNFCPICHKCYSDDDWESKMVQCAICESWVHAKCEELTDEQYQLVSFLPEEVQYTCRVCSTERPSYWELVLKSEFLNGLRNVLNALMSSKCAQMLLEAGPAREPKKPKQMKPSDSTSESCLSPVGTPVLSSSETNGERTETPQEGEPGTNSAEQFEESSNNSIQTQQNPDLSNNLEAPANASFDNGEIVEKCGDCLEVRPSVFDSVKEGRDFSDHNLNIPDRPSDVTQDKCMDTENGTDNTTIKVPSTESLARVLNSDRQSQTADSTDSQMCGESRQSGDSQSNSFRGEAVNPENQLKLKDVQVPLNGNVSHKIVPPVNGELENLGGSEQSVVQGDCDIDKSRFDTFDFEKSADCLPENLSGNVLTETVPASLRHENISEDSALSRKCNSSSVPNGLINSDITIPTVSFYPNACLASMPKHLFQAQGLFSSPSSNPANGDPPGTSAQCAIEIDDEEPIDKSMLYESLNNKDTHAENSSPGFESSGVALSITGRSLNRASTEPQGDLSAFEKHLAEFVPQENPHSNVEAPGVVTSQNTTAPTQESSTSQQQSAEVVPLTSVMPQQQEAPNKKESDPNRTLHVSFGQTVWETLDTNGECPKDFYSVKVKIDCGSYSTVEEFSEDMVRIIQATLFENEHFATRKKQANSVRSIFIKQMERCFPWFNVNTCKLWEHNRGLPAGMLKDAVIPPSIDHTYAQWLERKDSPMSPQPSPFKKISSPQRHSSGEESIPETSQNLPAVHTFPNTGDTRACLLCSQPGDDLPDNAGRLLYCGQDDWIHVNCALWSAEVFEAADGSLQNVQEAISRGKKLRCNLCQQPGATVGCCEAKCIANYHFMCARKDNYAFQEDKTTFCKMHRDCVDMDLLTEGGFDISRRVCVDLDKIRSRSSWGKAVDPSTLNVIIGSCTVESLGVLNSFLSDTEDCLFPVDYCCSRIYWSTQDARRRCVYTCRIVEFKPDTESSRIKIQDMRVIHDKSHPEFVPLDQLHLENLGIPNFMKHHSKMSELVDDTDDVVYLGMDSVVTTAANMSGSKTVLSSSALLSSDPTSTDSVRKCRSQSFSFQSTQNRITLAEESQNSEDPHRLSASWPLSSASQKPKKPQPKPVDLSGLSERTLALLSIKGPTRYIPPPPKAPRVDESVSSSTMGIPLSTVDEELGLVKIAERLNTAASGKQRSSSRDRDRGILRSPPPRFSALECYRQYKNQLERSKSLSSSPVSFSQPIRPRSNSEERHKSPMSPLTLPKQDIRIITASPSPQPFLARTNPKFRSRSESPFTIIKHQDATPHDFRSMSLSPPPVTMRKGFSLQARNERNETPPSSSQSSPFPSSTPTDNRTMKNTHSGSVGLIFEVSESEDEETIVTGDARKKSNHSSMAGKSCDNIPTAVPRPRSSTPEKGSTGPRIEKTFAITDGNYAGNNSSTNEPSDVMSSESIRSILESVPSDVLEGEDVKVVVLTDTEDLSDDDIMKLASAVIEGSDGEPEKRDDPQDSVLGTQNNSGRDEGEESHQGNERTPDEDRDEGENNSQGNQETRQDSNSHDDNDQQADEHRDETNDGDNERREEISQTSASTNQSKDMSSQQVHGLRHGLVAHGSSASGSGDDDDRRGQSKGDNNKDSLGDETDKTRMDNDKESKETEGKTSKDNSENRGSDNGDEEIEEDYLDEIDGKTSGDLIEISDEEGLENESEVIKSKSGSNPDIVEKLEETPHHSNQSEDLQSQKENSSKLTSESLETVGSEALFDLSTTSKSLLDTSLDISAANTSLETTDVENPRGLSSSEGDDPGCRKLLSSNSTFQITDESQEEEEEANTSQINIGNSEEEVQIIDLSDSERPEKFDEVEIISISGGGLALIDDDDEDGEKNDQKIDMGVPEPKDDVLIVSGNKSPEIQDHIAQLLHKPADNVGVSEGHEFETDSAHLQSEPALQVSISTTRNDTQPTKDSAKVKTNVKVLMNIQDTTDEESDYLMLDDFSYSETNETDTETGRSSAERLEQGHSVVGAERNQNMLEVMEQTVTDSDKALDPTIPLTVNNSDAARMQNVLRDATEVGESSQACKESVLVEIVSASSSDVRTRPEREMETLQTTSIISGTDEQTSLGSEALGTVNASPQIALKPCPDNLPKEDVTKPYRSQTSSESVVIPKRQSAEMGQLLVKVRNMSKEDLLSFISTIDITGSDFSTQEEFLDFIENERMNPASVEDCQIVASCSDTELATVVTHASEAENSPDSEIKKDSIRLECQVDSYKYKDLNEIVGVVEFSENLAPKKPIEDRPGSESELQEPKEEDKALAQGDSENRDVMVSHEEMTIAVQRENEKSAPRGDNEILITLSRNADVENVCEKHSPQFEGEKESDLTSVPDHKLDRSTEREDIQSDLAFTIQEKTEDGLEQMPEDEMSKSLRENSPDSSAPGHENAEKPYQAKCDDVVVVLDRDRESPVEEEEDPRFIEQNKMDQNLTEEEELLRSTEDNTDNEFNTQKPVGDSEAALLLDDDLVQDPNGTCANNCEPCLVSTSGLSKDIDEGLERHVTPGQEVSEKGQSGVTLVESEDEDEELLIMDNQNAGKSPLLDDVESEHHSLPNSSTRHELKERLPSESEDNLHEKIVEKIKAESLARSSPGEEGPFKCPTCKRMYRTRGSFESHIRDCDFEVSTSDEDEKPTVKELRSSKRYRAANEEKKQKSGTTAERIRLEKTICSSSASSLNEPLSIIITDEYKDDKFSPSSREFSDDCSSVQSQDSRRSSLRKSTVAQRNAAPAHLAKVRHRDSKSTMSPDGSTCSSLLSPRGFSSKLEEKPSPKETMLEAVGLVSRRSLELSPNSDVDASGTFSPQTRTLKLQPRISPTTMAVAPKREKKSPAQAGSSGNLRPSIMAGGVPKPGSAKVKSIAITYDPVVLEEVKMETMKSKRPRQKRIWWVEASESEGEEEEEEKDEKEEGESDEEGVALRTRRSRSRHSTEKPPLSGESKKSPRARSKSGESSLQGDEEKTDREKDSQRRPASAERRKTPPVSPRTRRDSPREGEEHTEGFDTPRQRSSKRLSSTAEAEGSKTTRDDISVKDQEDQNRGISSPSQGLKKSKGEENIDEVDAAEDFVLSKAKLRSGSKFKRDDDNDDDNSSSDHNSHSEDMLSPVRRSRRHSSKTAKLSEYLADLKKEAGKDETKTLQDTLTCSPQAPVESSPETPQKRGRGRPRIYPEKERPKAVESMPNPDELTPKPVELTPVKRGRGRPRLYPKKDGPDSNKYDDQKKKLEEFEKEKGQSRSPGRDTDHKRQLRSAGQLKTDIESPGKCDSERGVLANRDVKDAHQNRRSSLASSENDDVVDGFGMKGGSPDQDVKAKREGGDTGAEVTHRSQDESSCIDLTKEDENTTCKQTSELLDADSDGKSESKNESNDNIVGSNGAESIRENEPLSLTASSRKEDDAKDDDSGDIPQLPKHVTDAIKGSGQKLRIIIRSPNVVAAQKIGELIKKTAMTVNPKTSEVTMTTTDSSKPEIKEPNKEEIQGSETGPEKDDDEKQTEDHSEGKKSQKDGEVTTAGNKDENGEDIKSTDGTPLVSRSVSPDSISAAYDIQSDDFSSETSNDVDDYPSHSAATDRKAEVEAGNKITLDQRMAQYNSSEKTAPRVTANAVEQNNEDDDDDDVVIVKAIGLQPPEQGMAIPAREQNLNDTSSRSFTKLSGPPFHSLQAPFIKQTQNIQPKPVSAHHPLLPAASMGSPRNIGSQASHQPMNISPTGQNVNPLINLQQSQSPPQAQVVLSEVTPGRFILQQQTNPRQDFVPSHELSQSGLLLHNAQNQPGMILQNSGQTGILFPSVSQPGISLQSTSQSGVILRHANQSGLMLQQGTPSTLLQGQAPLLPGTGQTGLSFISLNPNPLASAIISPLQSLQSHVSPPSILPSALMSTASLPANQPLMLGQSFISQPGMFLPPLGTQTVVSEHMDVTLRQQQQQQHLLNAGQPTSSIIIDPQAHMLSTGLNSNAVKSSPQQISPPKTTPVIASSGQQRQNLTPQASVSAVCLPVPSTSAMVFSAPSFSSPTSSQLAHSPSSASGSTAAPLTPQPVASAPKLTRVDGAPAQVNYMGSFDLNSSTLQSVVKGQNITQNASQRIMELVQSALKSQGKEQIPGVQVTSAITNTPQGPKKVLRVFINEDILPVDKRQSPTGPDMSTTTLPTSLGQAFSSHPLSTTSAVASLLSLGQMSNAAGSQANLDQDWTKILPSSSQMQQQQQAGELWSSSNTGFVSIPINQNLTSSSRSSNQGKLHTTVPFRRALKPALSSNSLSLKRKHPHSSISGDESPQSKRPVFEKQLKSDGTFTGTMQQIVGRSLVQVSEPASPLKHDAQDIQQPQLRISQSHENIKALLSKHIQNSIRDVDSQQSSSLRQPQENESTITSATQFLQQQGHHPHHHIVQQQPLRSPHKRASFPLMSPAKKPMVQAVKSHARKQVLKKTLLKKDPSSPKPGQGLRPQTAQKRSKKVVSGRLKSAATGHHPLIHHKKGNLSLPQPSLEEEVVATPLDLGKGDHPHGTEGRSERERSRSRLQFEISSDDGFSCKGDTIEDAWNQVLEKVQDVRAAARMKQLSYTGISGRTMFGVDHDAVVYLIEQLYGAVHCHRNYKFKFHKYDLDQADEEVAVNPSGAARSESFGMRKPFDMFNFLKSVYRTRPGDDEREKEEEMALKSSRRATSLSLPMAMRFRKLKTFAKEAVDVYRSKIHGRGLFCKRNIDAGEMVIEYAGEVIRASLTDKREKYYESKGIGCYMFRIDDDEVVDATMHGSAARFINHSCEPNCFSKVILVDGKKHIVIFAMRPIKRGEELTYDYKFPIEEVKIPCSCGSKRCRKYLN